MPLVLSTGTVSRTEDDVMFDKRFGRFWNAEWKVASTVLQWGVASTKSGDIDFTGITMRFPNILPTIPPESFVTKAALKGTPANDQSGTLNSIIECLAPDGLWDADPESGDAWQDFQFGNNPGDFRVTIRDSSPTTLTTSDIGTGNNFRQDFRKDSSPGRFEELGESMQIETAGTLDEIDWTLAKVGAPTGNIWLKVWSQDGSGNPDTLLATSDMFDVSTLTVGLGLIETFVFSGGDQIPLALNDLVVVVLAGDFAINGIDWVESVFKMPLGTGGGYTLGTALTFGNGVGWDDHHYSSSTQVLVLPSAHPTFFEPWATPPFTAGVEVTTPDLSSIVQARINDGIYAEGDPIAIQIQRLTLQESAVRNFKGFDHPDTPGISNQITLEIEWRERALRTDA